VAKVELIAELATNFGADIELAKRFIREFAAAGVDTVKFQVFDASRMRRDNPQYEWFRQAQLTFRDYAQLRKECERAGVGFLATGYTPEDVALIAKLTDYRIKIGSAEAHSQEMVGAVHKKFAKVVVSTGLTEAAESPFASLRYYAMDIKFLGCVTRYPAPLGIAYAQMLQGKLHGWSDHSEGLNECEAAIIAGAKIVEFHVQLPNQARPAQAFEKTVEDVKALRAFADEDPYQRFVGRWNA